MTTTLPVSSYVVLGLLRNHAGATPYELDQRIRRSIGYFWGFPRSQLYAEAGRLVRRGLVAERQEDDGRRRRTLALTGEGRAELDRWLATPTRSGMEIHDEGLLRLFFQSADDPGAPAAIERLAGEQVTVHEERLAEYQALVATGRLRPGTPQRATLEAGLRLEQLMIDFWREMADGRQ